MFYLYMLTMIVQYEIYLLDGEKICRYALCDMNKEYNFIFMWLFKGEISN